MTTEMNLFEVEFYEAGNPKGPEYRWFSDIGHALEFMHGITGETHITAMTFRNHSLEQSAGHSHIFESPHWRSQSARRLDSVLGDREQQCDLDLARRGLSNDGVDDSRKRHDLHGGVHRRRGVGGDAVGLVSSGHLGVARLDGDGTVDGDCWLPRIRLLRI